MTTLTAQQIACVYAWLAQLFSRELDDEQLTQIASAQMAEWFSVAEKRTSAHCDGEWAGKQYCHSDST
ncbi:chaperone protein TorD [Escherichia coli]|uniref:Chaperone protein TorD n=1 Tax=Escherichia coli TaxID=562 RepID=A0A377K8A3_ECOLX|nr:chaperone protein TorD [Escherichia coli]